MKVIESNNFFSSKLQYISASLKYKEETEVNPQDQEQVYSILS